ncbi:DUF2834 domain-containing protein [Mycolicibacterium houstonense]|uniref:DUF2834 domain-containing protein n=1 Tax=Mycolicibacterium houstonense TaxID=146021 RepID=UPI0008305420|nr:DUF2834 domain-containing protein [Mycolicibacterium houstonense]
MVSLIVHAILGVAVVVLVIRLNPHIFSRPPGPALSRAELAYYLVGLASIPICWYFNAQFIAQYAVPDGNPIWGPGSWTEFITLGYTNPAASSASADYTIANVVLLPLFTIIDGLRRGIRHPWLFFVASLFTSFAFAFAFYFATMERQRRHQRAEVAVN